MRIALAPEFTDAEKASLRAWLTRILGNATLCNSGSGVASQFPFTNRIAVYVDGVAHSVQHGYWNRVGAVVGVGLENAGGNVTSQVERIAILGAIISAVGLWETLTDAYSTAVSRTLLESYNTALSGLVRTQQGIATGLAFSADRNQMAAMMGGEWHLPNGQAVVVDETWMQLQ